MSVVPLRRDPLDLASRYVDLTRPVPPMEWHPGIPNLTAPGCLTLLAGEGGVGKTSLAMFHAHQVANSFHDDGRRREVAILSGENVHSLSHLSTAMRLTSPTVSAFDGDGLDLAHSEDRTWLEQSTTGHGLDLLVLDSLAAFSGGREENSNTEMRAYVGGLQKLAERTGCAILLIHHMNKSGGQRGASAIRDAIDISIDLTADSRDRDVLKLTPDKWRIGPSPDPLRVRRVVRPPSAVGSQLWFEVVDGLSKKERLTRILTGLPEGDYTTDELRARCGLTSERHDDQALSDARKPFVGTEWINVSNGLWRKCQPSR